MSIELKLKNCSREEFREIYNQYLQYDFPREERIPLSACLRLRDKGKMLIHGFYEGENLRGYAVTVPDKCTGALFLEYFAVLKQYRGRGYGSEMLRLMKRSFSEHSYLYLQVESPEAAREETERKKRERRRRFYLHAGLSESGVLACAFGVRYHLLTYAFSVSPKKEELRKGYLRLYRMKLGRVVTMLHVWARTAKEPGRAQP